MTLFAIISSLIGGNDNEPTMGPDAIGRARREMRDKSRINQALARTPYLRDRGGTFSDKYEAVIPLTCPADTTDPAPLTFDLEDEDLDRFCEAFGVTVDDIGEIEGEKIPIEWLRGTPIPCWDSLDELDDIPEVEE